MVRHMVLRKKNSCVLSAAFQTTISNLVSWKNVRKGHLKQVKPLLMLPVIADRNKPSFMKELFNDEDSKTCPDGDDHRTFPNFDDFLPAAEEKAILTMNMRRTLKFLVGQKTSFQLRNMQRVSMTKH